MAQLSVYGLHNAEEVPLGTYYVELKKHTPNI
jgi:hypothetical protein